ncbi:MAG TPA: GntG family PLP-dependent aldolase [Nocardioidaceae bacterium]|nr:GntG family PLP-dependent aldolase [Nocardioidaceae bacterium]
MSHDGRVDLRSDTVTRPTDAVRAAVAAADVGDDVFGDDPTVIRLEERVAELLGFDAALYTVTGSMANVLAVRALAGPGTEVLCESSAHIVRAELGAHGAITGVTTRTWTHPDGFADLAAIDAMVAPDLGPHFVTTTCVSVENTHNFAGGRTQPIEVLRGLRELADRRGVGVHLDGARIWNAHVASGIALPELAGVGDTAGVCLSKGLGAPMGSLMLGSVDQIAEARVWRKRLGGGWRQAGMMAAAGLYVVDHHIERLADDHRHARLIAEAAGVDPEQVDTNIVVIATPDAPVLVGRCRDEGVLVAAVGPSTVRVVTHLDVSGADAERAAKVIAAAIAA